jgi:hypothetical protein
VSSFAQNVFVDHCRFEKNDGGLLGVNFSTITVRDSVAAMNVSYGFRGDGMGGSIAFEIDSSIADGNGSGIQSDTLATINVSNSVATHNGIGLSANAGTLRASSCSVTTNVTGLSTANGGVLLSRQNNTVENNGTDGAFTGTFNPK